MRKIIFLLSYFIVVNSCSSQINISNVKTIDIKRKIVSIYENDKAYILVSDNNDIIEVFKNPLKIKKCKKISLNKEYVFKVYSFDYLLQYEKESNKYMPNDSTIINYKSLYTAKKYINYCYEK